MHHRLRLGAVLTAMTLVLLGCSEDPTPKFAPPQTTPPAPTATSPEQTQTPTPQELTPEETVRAWVKARNKAMRTGDIAAVEALSAANCQACRYSFAPIREVHANGGYFKTEGWRVVSSRVKSQSDAKAVVPVALVYAPGRTLPAAGAEVVSYDQEKHIAEFRLVVQDDEWAVSFLGYLS